MSKDRFDIQDDDIRIIASDNAAPASNQPGLPIALTIIGVAVLLGVAAMVYVSFSKDGADGELDVGDTRATHQLSESKGFTEVRDTIVGDTPLAVFTPRDATPTLEIGLAPLSDPSTVLAVWAADTRGDNGMIAGACVIDGELVSRGEAKAGFCAIVNGEMTVGTADATPMLEEAIASGGQFFRQYPLVVGGQPIENKPKGKSLRRALVEMDGHHSVVLSLTPLSLNDFARALSAMGVRNAISLVGSSTPATYLAADSTRHMLGPEADPSALPHNINFLVWR